MNITKINLMIVAIMLATVFAACKKDSKDIENLVINATDVQGNDSDIATVKAVFLNSSAQTYQDHHEVASTQYQNHGFKLTLPGTIPDKYLINIEDGYGNIPSIHTNKKNANIGFIRIDGFDSNGDFNNFNMRDYQNDQNYIAIDYVYVDRDVIVKGKKSQDVTVDCSFKKGYNVRYTVLDAGKVLETTTKPADANFKWYLDREGGSEDFVINATDVQGNDNNVTTVKAYIFLENHEVASVPYQNHGFKLTLPGTFPAEYLMNITSFYGTSSDISDISANIGHARIQGYGSNGQNGKDLYMLDYRNKHDYISVFYVYVDRDVTVKGNYYDCSFKKGYNIVYDVFDGQKILETTTKPANANFKWYYDFTGEVSEDFVINATDVQGDDSNVTTVKATTQSGHTVASTQYQNHGFKLTLSETIPVGYLDNIGNAHPLFKDPSIHINDRNAKANELEISNNGNIGYFYTQDLQNHVVEVKYFYVDRDVIVEGVGTSIIVDCSFKKGYNIMYIVYDNYKTTYTTTKPANVNLKWYFNCEINGKFIINATNVQGDDSNVTTVKAVIDNFEHTVASAPYQNHGFQLELTETISAEYLENIVAVFIGGLYISERNAKTNFFQISGYSTNGYIGNFYMLDTHVNVMFFYVDRDVIVKGYDDNFTYDCSLKKGYNVVYVVFDDQKVLQTTTKPANANFKWRYNGKK